MSWIGKLTAGFVLFIHMLVGGIVGSFNNATAPTLQNSVTATTTNQLSSQPPQVATTSIQTTTSSSSIVEQSNLKPTVILQLPQKNNSTQQTSNQQPPIQQTSNSPPDASAALQMKVQCATLGQQKENSDNAVGDLIRASYGFSPTMNTCIYAAEYQFSPDTIGGTYFDLLTNEKIGLSQAGAWSMTTYTLPSNSFILNGNVYSCTGFTYTSTNNQTGEANWIQIQNSSCGYLWVYMPALTPDKVIVSVDAIPRDYIAYINDFWNKYYELVPQ